MKKVMRVDGLVTKVLEIFLLLLDVEIELGDESFRWRHVAHGLRAEEDGEKRRKLGEGRRWREREGEREGKRR